jgi:hypothetical protein
MRWFCASEGHDVGMSVLDFFVSPDRDSGPRRHHTYIHTHLAHRISGRMVQKGVVGTKCTDRWDGDERVANLLHGLVGKDG